MRKLYDEQSDVVMPHPLSMNGSYKGTTIKCTGCDSLESDGQQLKWEIVY